MNPLNPAACSVRSSAPIANVGVRRPTPGWRREELADVKGLGVTWITWLEQGRPVNASVPRAVPAGRGAAAHARRELQFFQTTFHLASHAGVKLVCLLPLCRDAGQEIGDGSDEA